MTSVLRIVAEDAAVHLRQQRQYQQGRSAKEHLTVTSGLQGYLVKTTVGPHADKDGYRLED